MYQLKMTNLPVKCERLSPKTNGTGDMSPTALQRRLEAPGRVELSSTGAVAQRSLPLQVCSSGVLNGERVEAAIGD